MLFRSYETETGYCLKIVDDGNGLPEDFVMGEQTSLGLKIIKTMVEADLNGKFYLEQRVNGIGTCAKVIIPYKGVEGI